MEKKYLNASRYQSERDPFEVDDYPWGFRLRTSRMSWVESKKGFGQRLVHQTLNPKTGLWCKPKKSTYYPVIGLFINEKGHLDYETLSSGGWSKEDRIKEFESNYGESLTDFQKEQIKYIRATNIMNEVISYEIKPSEPVSLTKIMNGDPVEQAKVIKNEAGRQTEKEKQEILNKAFAYGMGVVEGKIERVKNED